MINSTPTIFKAESVALNDWELGDYPNSENTASGSRDNVNTTMSDSDLGSGQTGPCIGGHRIPTPVP